MAPKQKAAAASASADKKQKTNDVPTTELYPSTPLEDENLLKYHKYIDSHQDVYVERLREAVAIASVSAWPTHRPEVLKMINYTKDWIDKLGGSTSLFENPLKTQEIEVDGETKKIPLPPVLLGTFGNDPEKYTVCVCK
jgi:hypothetical protein